MYSTKHMLIFYGVIITIMLMVIVAVLASNHYDSTLERSKCENLKQQGFNINIISHGGVVECKLVYEGLLFDSDQTTQLNLLKLKDKPSPINYAKLRRHE